MSRVDVILKQMKHSEPKCMQEKKQKKKKKKKKNMTVRCGQKNLSFGITILHPRQNSDPRAKPHIRISQCKVLIVVVLLWRNFLAGRYREV